jgi:hypothetical protein
MLIGSIGGDMGTYKEVLHSQISELQQLLGSQWKYYGVGRDDGKEKGEYSPIFYNR